MIGFLGSRFGNSSDDDHVAAGEICGLHETVHELGHQYHDQENPAEESQCVFLHGPIIVWDMDVYFVCLYRSQCGALSSQSF